MVGYDGDKSLAQAESEYQIAKYQKALHENKDKISYDATYPGFEKVVVRISREKLVRMVGQVKSLQTPEGNAIVRVEDGKHHDLCREFIEAITEEVREDGTTLIDKMIDAALFMISENGSESLTEVR